MLLTLCQKSDGQPLAGVIVIGEGHSARAIAMAATSMGLPILWAKGGTANMDGMHREVSCGNFIIFSHINVYNIFIFPTFINYIVSFFIF